MAKKVKTESYSQEEKKTFKDYLYEQYPNLKNYTSYDVAKDTINQLKASIQASVAYANRHSISRIYMNGLKIEAVIGYFTKEGFDVYSEQRYTKHSNNTGNQYTYIKISWLQEINTRLGLENPHMVGTSRVMLR